MKNTFDTQPVVNFTNIQHRLFIRGTFFLLFLFFFSTDLHAQCPNKSSNKIELMVALCDESVATIFGSTPTGGSGTYTYQWQKTERGNCGSGKFSDIPEATGMHY